MSVYLGWRLFFTLPVHDGIISMIMGVALLYSEAISAFGTFELFWKKKKDVHLELPDIPDEWFPEVDIFIATHNEPVSLLYNTINAATFIDYPDLSKRHIHVCDDGNRPEVEKLCEEFQVHYIGCPNNKEAKAGNLNHAMSLTHAPLIVTFDADMIPRRRFLRNSVPYFFLPRLIRENGVWRERTEEELDSKYKIGFIQTPQSFYNPDLFQFNLYAEETIPNEQNFFTKEVNVMNNSTNAVAYTGSNTILLRRAMEEIGGFPTDTITEDFETGIRIQSMGYVSYATSEVLASGLTPTSIKSMMSQRVRWARGVTQSIRNMRVPFNGKLTAKARLSYMVSYSYWWSFLRRMIFTLSPILFALFDMRIVECGFWDLLLFWAPAHVFYGITMQYVSSDMRNSRWCQIIDTIMAPYLIFPVLFESLGIKQQKFIVTKKTSDEKKKKFTLHYAIPHIILLIMSMAGFVRFVNGKFGIALLYSSIIIFWLVHNVINLSYAIFFMCGREIKRQTERFDADEKLTIALQDKTIETRIINISEGGIAFRMKETRYFPDDEPISFTLHSEEYRAEFTGRIIFVKKNGEEWNYSVKIEQMDEENRKQYLQFVYDRIPTFPEKLDVWVTAYDDLLNNAHKRVEKQRSEMRGLPRIRVGEGIFFESGEHVWADNFNFKYLLVRGKLSAEGMVYQWRCDFDLYMYLQEEPEAKVRPGSNMHLLRVVNYEQLVYNEQFLELVNTWVERENMENREMAERQEAMENE
ncbi:MAG: glycosyltransferase [Lachnospiraceae bacterium]|nr:glycosyltransferase [Lachnospiraceae bacterium]